MALSDVELLLLTEVAEKKTRGPQGEPGVGIASFEQLDGTKLVIVLTDGQRKEIQLPQPQDGAVGPAGIQGRQGERGRDGRPGRDGIQGSNGKDGLPGPAGTSIDTAVVNSDGDLLLGFSDGAIVNAGRVLGPAGASGERGATGLAGEPGKDGAAVLSGPRPPQASDGIEGDHWIDVGNASFDFWKKSGTGWTMLASLRQPAQDRRMGVGGAGGGNGGNGGTQTSGTLPLANPTRLGNAKGLPDTSNLKTQADFNVWTVGSLESLANGVPPEVNLDGYAKTEDIPTDNNQLTNGAGYVNTGYVDQADNALSGRIQAVEQDYTTSAEFSTVSQQVTTNKNDIKALQAVEQRVAALEQQVANLVELVPPVDYGQCNVSGGNDYNAENNACWLPQNELGVFTCELTGNQTHGCRYIWSIARGQARISGSETNSVVTMQCTDPAPNTVVLRCDVSHPTTEEVVHAEIQILVQELD